MCLRIFKNAYDNSSAFKGNVFVLNSDGICLFDSENTLLLSESFPFAEYSASHFENLATNGNYIVNMLRSEETGFTFINIVDKQVVVEETEVIRRNIYTIIMICVVVMMLISLLSSVLFSRRIKSLVNNMRDVESGRFDTHIQVKTYDEIGYLEHSFHTMCTKLDEYIKAAYVLELKKRTAGLKARSLFG